MGKIGDQLFFELRPIAAGNDGHFDDAEKVAQKRRHFGIKRRFAFSNRTIQVENNQPFHHFSTFFPCAEAEDADDRPCDHEFLVGANDTHGDLTTVRRNQRRVLCVAPLVQFNAEEAELIADPSRTSGAFSPIPPVKTSVSNPPSAAAKEPIHFLA